MEEVKDAFNYLQQGSFEVVEILVRARDSGYGRIRKVHRQISAEGRTCKEDVQVMRFELSEDDRPHKDDLVAENWECRRRGENDWVCNKGSDVEYARGP